MLIASLVPVGAVGQSWTLPRTADGQPDLQGTKRLPEVLLGRFPGRKNCAHPNCDAVRQKRIPTEQAHSEQVRGENKGRRIPFRGFVANAIELIR
jgi:hypothetical protein